jgi:glycosyltransferase involved in cell wall biosynthesis
MNIAIFTNNYLPNPYGVTTSIESFRKQFEKRGHTVYVFAPESSGYIDKNKNIFRYPSLDIRYKIKFPIPIPYSTKIDKKIKELDFDIIHSQHPNLIGEAAMKWAKKKKIPLIFTWHTLYNKYAHYVPVLPDKISSFLATRVARIYANKADKVIIPTASVRSIIEGWGVNNSEIVDIATGVEREHFKNPDGEKIRESLKISQEKKVIMSISRFTQEKNVIFLLKSIIGVLKKHPKTVFVFGGEGYLKKEMQEIIAKEEMTERVIFPGMVKKNNIKNYLNAADIFVYASKSETQGTIITESMFSSLPIVAVNETGSQSLIEDGKSGILVPESEDDFQEAVEKILEDDDLSENLRKNAKIESEKKYTSDVCADKMLEAYRSTIEKFKNKLY